MNLAIPSTLRIKAGALAALFFVGAAGLRAQVIPPRPPGLSDQQVQQQIESRGLGDIIRQRIASSGMTPDQVRARLRSAGYSESLVDAYLTPATAGQRTPAPNAEVMRALSALGFNDLALQDSSLLDSLHIDLTRADSLYLDSLGIVIGVDSIPVVRDSLGVLGLDTIALRRLSERLRRPRVFGLDVFRRTTTLFTPMQNGPVDENYRIGPGDELVLILTGQVEAAYSLPVTRDGFVIIPLAGQVYAANLTIGQLREVLYTRLGRVYSGIARGSNARTQFDITVAKVRSNQVFVNGEVARPGAYAVSATGTVMNALYQAGGLTERGNFRAVRIMRGGRAVDTLDLYDFLLAGNTRGDVRLEQGDVVYVPTRERRVAVLGAVLRPALYDIAAGEGLRDAIRMAGGLSAEADVTRALIERILPPTQRSSNGRDRTVITVDLRQVLGDSAAASYRLEPDDRVTIFSVTQPVRNHLVLRGNVWRPGVYELDSNMTLAQLIALAGGTKPDTYLERVHIQRLQPDSTRRLIAASLQPGAPQVALAEFDEITVYGLTSFRPPRTVTVFGAVQKPGPLPFRDSMRLVDAVIMAGGLRDNAYLLQAEISRLPNERDQGQLAQLIQVPLDSSFVLDQTSYFQRPAAASSTNPILQPYDNVFIRRLPGWEVQRNVVVTGEVRFPGRYTLTQREEKISDLMARVGGFTNGAYVRGAQLYRAVDRSGRVGIDLERVMREPAFRDNLILLAGDSIHIPPFQPVVVVEGEVNSPVGVAYVPNRDAGFYVDRAGGFARNADRRRTYVVQPNGLVARGGTRVEPGARVVVPSKPQGDTGPNWAQILTITSGLVTTLLSIIVISRQL